MHLRHVYLDTDLLVFLHSPLCCVHLNAAVNNMALQAG